MMIDSALKDTSEEDDRLINFDKHRKEFELLTQIRLLQAAAALYHIEPDPDFWQKFCSIPIYSDSERFSSSDPVYQCLHLFSVSRVKKNCNCCCLWPWSEFMDTDLFVTFVLHFFS